MEGPETKMVKSTYREDWIPGGNTETKPLTRRKNNVMSTGKFPFLHILLKIASRKEKEVGV